MDLEDVDDSKSTKSTLKTDASTNVNNNKKSKRKVMDSNTNDNNTLVKRKHYAIANDEQPVEYIVLN